MASTSTFEAGPLPERADFVKMEEKVIAQWKAIDAFKTQLKLSEGKPEYVFYDGPPFATGLPHYGHILAGTIKDTVTRYASQTGHFVSRRFGWDCHGLPVEYEIDKMLDIKGRDDVLAMGIDKYNASCRSIVSRYCQEWEQVVSRLGRWVSFASTENPAGGYRTLDPSFMESVWWVWKRLWTAGLCYRGRKVMPFSAACNTPLSNFEAGLNYHEETPDPAVVVSFPLINDPEGQDASLLAWTTTPWTLPSNLALCVSPTLVYCRLKDKKTGKTLIMAESRIVQLYPKAGKAGKEGAKEEDAPFEILSRFPGSTLVGLRYRPLFPYFQSAPFWSGPTEGPDAVNKDGSGFRVVSDTYVSDDAGTGVVHQAPAFGEDDWRVCLATGVTTKDGPLPCPIDANGRFTVEVPDFKGQWVKDADEAICARLKAEGRLLQKGTIIHSYPFCWRSDTPLIYRAVPSWFVSVEALKDRLLANNDETRWTPDAIKTGRFANWLRDARDWAVSRNRYWGTPLPIWTSEDGEEIVVIGSVRELQEKSGVLVTDLHRESVDHITIPSSMGKGVLRRVEEVFDCWFESGSMPYASIHYPFSSPDSPDFASTGATPSPFATPNPPPGSSDPTARRPAFKLPADFIAEGLDQTRGWFYTLMVLSTALFDKPAFKNLIVNGLVLAEDGKKMSKRLKNYPDPMLVVSRYGADALRLYLIDSPVVRGEPLRFKESGVLGVVKELLLPWYNALRFLQQTALRLSLEADLSSASPLVKASLVPAAAAAQGVPSTSPNGGFVIDPSRGVSASSSNAMDRWIIAAVQSLIRFVRQEMEGYRLYTVVPRLVSFIKTLTNWYVRLNRRRLKGLEGDDEAVVALNTLHSVLLDVALLMAPFTPFFAETLYQHLKVFFPPQAPSADVAASNGVTEAVGYASSVHYCPIPSFDAAKINEALELRVARMQAVVEAGRQARDARKISLKQPVAEVVIVSSDPSFREDISALADYVKEELNSLAVVTTGDEAAWCSYKLEPNPAALGKRLGAAFPKVVAALAKYSQEEIVAFMSSGSVTVEGQTLVASDLILKRLVHPELSGKYEACVGFEGKVLVAVNTQLDDRLKSMGAAREICNRVQRLRKKLLLLPSDELEAYYSVERTEHEEYVRWMQVAAKKAAAGAGGDDEGGADAPEAPAADATPSAGGAAAKGGKGGKGGAANANNKKGGKDTPAAAASPAADASAATPASTLAVRDAAVAALHTAVVANQSLISGALNLHLLPDLPSARPPHAVALGSDDDIIGGARLCVLLTRKTVRFPASDDALTAAVTSAASAQGVALDTAAAVAPQVTAAQGPAGQVRFHNGKPAADAVPVPAAGPANLPKSASTIVAGVKTSLASADASKLLQSAAANGGSHSVTVDGVKVSLKLGAHFFGSAQQFLAADAAASGKVKESWKAEGGEVALKLAEIHAALA